MEVELVLQVGIREEIRVSLCVNHGGSAAPGHWQSALCSIWHKSPSLLRSWSCLLSVHGIKSNLLILVSRLFWHLALLPFLPLPLTPSQNHHSLQVGEFHIFPAELEGKRLNTWRVPRPRWGRWLGAHQWDSPGEASEHQRR